MPNLSQKLVKDLFNYDPATGVLVRVKQTGSRALIGDTPWKDAYGYLNIAIHGKKYKVHRIIWLWYYGYMPESIVEHKDRNPENNKIDNLREVSQSCNLKNTKVRIDNTSGIKGVHLDSFTNKWRASISVNGVTKKLGRFQSFEEAVLHRYAAEQCLGWEYCDFNSSAHKFIAGAHV